MIYLVNGWRSLYSKKRPIFIVDDNQPMLCDTDWFNSPFHSSQLYNQHFSSPCLHLHPNNCCLKSHKRKEFTANVQIGFTILREDLFWHSLSLSLTLTPSLWKKLYFLYRFILIIFFSLSWPKFEAKKITLFFCLSISQWGKKRKKENYQISNELYHYIPDKPFFLCHFQELNNGTHWTHIQP